MKKQYNEIADSFEKTEKIIIKEFVIDPTFIKIIENPKGLDIIDLACGNGHFTRIMKNMGANVCGVDISEKQIKIAKSKSHGIDYFIDDVSDINFSMKNKFDIATAVFLLHYASTEKELQIMCSNISKLLKKDGKFITINPSPENPAQKNKKYDITAEVNTPVKDGCERKVIYYKNGKELCSFLTYHWSREKYEAALKKAGFQDIEWIEPLVSKKGVEKFGEDFWKEFIESPHLIAFRCRKG